MREINKDLNTKIEFLLLTLGQVTLELETIFDILQRALHPWVILISFKSNYTLL